MSRPAVGVDVGGTKILATCVEPDGTVVGSARTPTPPSGEAILDAARDLVIELSNGSPADLAGVGVGVPGLVDKQGILRFAPNLPRVVGLDVAGGLGSRLSEGLPDEGPEVFVDNDANCAAAAEQAFGAARGCSDVLVVTLGTGIGGGVFAGGRMLRGAGNFAGEIGHMAVDPHGPPCPCGKRGCWERYASGSGLARLARDAATGGRATRVLELAGGDEARVTGQLVVQAAEEGDTEALAVLGQFAFWVGLGLANLANLLDPEVIVLGGGLVEAGEILLAPTRS
ncbi:MAG TPA: ROK family protein, partial [Acidimicrobiales bacterium]|nr:ROK family protein [Acidimicrobiales bacterium]